MEDLGEKAGDVVCLDDSSCSPDLNNVLEVHRPVVFFICCIDDADSLDVSSETGSVDSLSEILDECSFLFLVAELKFGGKEGAVEGLVDVFPMTTIGGGKS